VANEQFGKFVEVIKKLYVNILLLGAMQVPTYAKYLKDILGSKTYTAAWCYAGSTCSLQKSVA
jgi:hypothetical protein